MTRTVRSPVLTRTTLILGIAGVLLAAGCTADDAPPGDAATPAAAGSPSSVVLVTANEFSFTMPDTIVGGVSTFRLTDAGMEPHHLMMVRLDGGHTVDDLMAAMSSPTAPMPEWAVFVGGPNSPTPGSTEATEVTVELEPGNYVALCMVPSPDGVPHVAKGMIHPFVVVAPDSSGTPPRADVEMSLVDYDYPMDEPIRAGRRVIRVTNDAGQPHEVLFVRFDEGQSMEQLVAWEQNMEGPMPATLVGGTAPMGPGAVNYITADFQPGEYGLICFVPDAGDGRPHTMHGMIKTITVR